MMYFEQYLNTLSMLLKKHIIEEGKSKHKRKHTCIRRKLIRNVAQNVRWSWWTNTFSDGKVKSWFV